MIHSVTTRASERLYIIMENLREGIAVPKNKSWRNDALRLRLSREQFVNHGNEAIARRQLRLVKLYDYIGRLRNCYESDAVRATSWYSALLNDAYWGFIDHADPAAAPRSMGLKQCLLCTARFRVLQHPACDFAVQARIRVSGLRIRHPGYASALGFGYLD